MTGGITEQDLVVHLFAPAKGPRAAAAHAALHTLWDRAHTLLGMHRPILDLPTDLPPDLGTTVAGTTVAAREDRQADFQMVCRRHHDVLNLSLVFAAPLPTGERRRTIGSSVPEGWIEFSRWWDEIRAAVPAALTTEVVAYLGKHPDPCAAPVADVAAAVLPSLPLGLRALNMWSDAECRAGGFLVWEPAPGIAAKRTLVVLADEGRDPELSTWAWSGGDPAMPPLARYLLHAGELRHQARVWQADQDALGQLQSHVDTLAGRLRADFAQQAVWTELRAAEAALISAAARSRDAIRGTQRAAENMRTAIGAPLHADLGRAEWLAAQLSDTVAGLDNAADLARRTRELGRDETVLHPKPTPNPVAPPPPLLSRPDDGVIRTGFAVDIVGYSNRPAARRPRLQERLAAVVADVLRDLDLTMSDTDHQGTGDGLIAFLPPTVGVRRAVRALLCGMRQRLADDNAEYQDRLRLRLSATTGPVGLAALGFSGGAGTVLGRLLNHEILRNAMRDHDRTDVAALVADPLFRFATDDGESDVDSSRFRCHRIDARGYQGDAWLWLGDGCL